MLQKLCKTSHCLIDYAGNPGIAKLDEELLEPPICLVS